MSVNDEWNGILREGERILWQGQPDGGIYIHPSRKLTFRTGIPLMTFGSLFFLIPLAMGEVHPFVFVFLIFWSGLSGYFIWSQFYWPAYKRRHTFYTLTDQRAILGIALPRRKRRLKTFEIEVNEAPQKFAAGFVRFAEADKVWPMIQDLQQEMRDARAQASDSKGAVDV